MGMSCLETAWVTGYKRVPEPPAKIIPLRFPADEDADEAVSEDGFSVEVAIVFRNKSVNEWANEKN